MASNVVASNQYRSLGAVNSTELLSYEGILIISLGSKELNSSDENKTSFNIQCWLGVAMIVLWGIMFLFIKVQ